MRKGIPTGSLFQRTYRDADGRQQKTATWFIHYYVKGKPVRMATGTTDRAEALQILREKMAKAAEQNKYSSDVERVLVDQLLDLVIEDYQFNERGSAHDTELRINKHLRPFFGDKRAAGLTTPLINKYTGKRAKEAAAATVNKELAHLRRALSWDFGTSRNWLPGFHISVCSRWTMPAAVSCPTSSIAQFAMRFRHTREMRW